MQDFSFEKASKFKDKDKFYDINYLFVPGLRWVVEELYSSLINPEMFILLSLVLGVVSAGFYAAGDYSYSIAGLILIFFKNYADTVDGYLARARGVESRLGRFLDSIADAVVYICLFTGLAINLLHRDFGFAGFVLAYAAMISAFLQCSVYNYYLVSYQTFLEGEGINRTDEGFREREKWSKQKTLSGKFLFILQLIYQIIYGWQDCIVASFDKALFRKFKNNNHALEEEEKNRLWYADKKFLSIVSPLCFGTQIILLCLFTLFDLIECYLWFMLIIGNIYGLVIMIWRVRKRLNLIVHD